MTVVTRDDVRLEVEAGGTGPETVVFLHALGGRLAFWRPVLRHVQRHRRTVALDLRGHAGSEAAPGARWGLGAFADDVLAVADALGVQRFALVGHSFGATVALAVAAHAPARVTTLVLVDPAGNFAGMDPEQLEAYVASVEGPGGAEVLRDAYGANLERARLSTRAAVLSSLVATPRPVVAAGYRAIFAADPADLARRYGGPVTLVTDEANSSPYALGAQHPEFRAYAMPEVSHWLPLDDPDGFCAILDAVLGPPTH